MTNVIVMRTAVLSLLFITSFLVSAQHSFYGNLDTQLGYKHNIFNGFRIDDEEIEDDSSISPIQSGAYTNVGLNMGYRYRKKKNYLVISAVGNKQIYFSKPLADLLNVRLNGVYRRTFSKASNLVMSASWLNKSTAREENGSYAFNVPRGFKMLTSSLKYTFKIAKLNTVNISANYRKQDLDPNRGRQSISITRGAQLQLTKIIGETKRYVSSVLLSFNYQQRDLKNYTKKKLTKSELLSERLWRSLNVRLAYQYKMGKKLLITPSLTFLHNEVNIINGNYRQLTPVVNMRWTKKKYTISMNASQMLRFHRTTDLVKSVTIRQTRVTSVFLYKLKKGWNFTPSLSFLSYKDYRNDNRNYQLIIPALKASWRRKKLTASISFSRQHKIFSRPMTNVDRVSIMQFTLNGSLACQYRLASRFILSTNLRLLNRGNSIPENYSTTLPELMTSTVYTGLRYRL